MRHRYETSGIVLGRVPVGESSVVATLLTPTLGLIRARAQGVRASGAKLAPALTTFAESSVIVVRGKEGWRVAGALQDVSWSAELTQHEARDTAARIAGLVVRLVGGEMRDPELFAIVQSLFRALTTLSTEEYEAAEILAALRILRVLGLDAGEIAGAADDFSSDVLTQVIAERSELIKRINVGLGASGL